VGSRASIIETDEAQRGESEAMSRGPGRLQRQIVQRLEAAPRRSLSRRALEERFVGHGRYVSSNLRRALVGLERMGYVSLEEGPNLDQSYVSLPPPVAHLSDEVVSQLLAQIRDRS
jgi:hypothetical protein